jgi:hypothetical protein
MTAKEVAQSFVENSAPHTTEKNEHRCHAF